MKRNNTDIINRQLTTETQETFQFELSKKGQLFPKFTIGSRRGQMYINSE